jgi:hypothetical protein
MAGPSCCASGQAAAYVDSACIFLNTWIRKAFPSKSSAVVQYEGIAMQVPWLNQSENQ